MRIGGKILGGLASGIHPMLGKMVGSAAGRSANDAFNISDAKFVAKFKCPYCGATFK